MRSDAATPDELLEHAEWLRALALRLTRDEAAAEDLVQDTWTAALASRPRGGNLRPWLARVLQRFARRRLRGEHRRRERERQAAMQRPDRSDAEVQKAFEAQRELAALVAELSEPYRTVVMRRYYDGQTAAEIALHSQVPAATVRSQLVRARAMLRARWRQTHDDPSGRRLAGLALIAGRVPQAMQQAALMKTAHSGIVVAICALVAASLWGGYAALNPAVNKAGPEAAAPVLAHTENEPRESLEVVAAAPEREALSLSEEPTRTTEEATTESSSRLFARILDHAGQPISGAQLDSPERERLGSATSDARGNVVFAAQKEHLNLWNGQSQPDMFRIRAKGCATLFLRAAIELDRDTDLGDLRLEPGGQVVGRVIDGAGAPIEHARVIACDAALGRAPEVARLTGPSSKEGRITTLTDSDGAYRMSGLPLGSARVWVHLEGFPWQFSPVLEILAATQAPDLVLDSLHSGPSISGVVLGPHGEAMPGAVVLVTRTGPGRLKTSRIETDSEGHFHAIVQKDIPHQVDAYDAAETLTPACAEYVMAGADGLELRLTEIRWVEVSLLDEADGTPLEEPWVYLRTNRRSYGGNHVPFPKTEKTSPGRVRAPVPQGEFHISASTPGYAYESEGPYTVETMASEYVLRLKRKPVVRGRVLADGQPLQGARVQTVRTIDNSRSMVTEGFRTRLFTGGTSAAETDEEGRFEHPVNLSLRGGDHVLLVSAEGWSATELVLGTVDSDVNDAEVVMTRGGSIEGDLLLPAGRDARGGIVAASNGNGLVLKTRADESGLYRFENLAPGPWEVRHREEDEEWVMGFTREPHVGSYKGDCVVTEGQTTRYDIDTRAGAIPIQGRLRIDGQAASKWTARIEDQDAHGTMEPADSVVLDSSGEFTLEGSKNSTVLILESLDSNEPFASLRRVLDRAAIPNLLDLEITTGRLTGNGPAGSRLKLQVELPDGWHYDLSLDLETAGDFELTIPSGMVTTSVAEAAGNGFIRWQPGPEIELAAGGQAVVELD